MFFFDFLYTTTNLGLTAKDLENFILVSVFFKG